MMFYLVSEIQEINGARNVINYAFDNQKSAEGKYYGILSAATQSQADYKHMITGRHRSSNT